MGRRYSVMFEAVSVSAAQDLFEIKCHATKTLKLLYLEITYDNGTADSGDAQEEQLPILIQRLATGFTTGSGGGTNPTPAPLISGDTAAGFTCEINNTTPATGTASKIVRAGFNNRAGYTYIPTPECQVEAAATEAIIVKLVTAPADAILLSGYAILEESV